MEIQYVKWYSPALGRDMEVKTYGHGGAAVLYIPCQNGRFFDFENFNMHSTWSGLIDSGKVTVYSLDTVDSETWTPKDWDARWRICRHEQWIRYITEELVPFIHFKQQERGVNSYEDGIAVFGCSLGAFHAANLYFRFPDTFRTLLALSGLYTAEYGFDGYMDDLVYLNSPVHYLSQMAADHPYIEKYNRNRAIICTGTGAWEVPHATFDLKHILEEKGIAAWVDIWGEDVCHDWCWWHRQAEYFAPKLFG